MSNLAGLTNLAYTASSLANLILVTPENTGIQAQSLDGKTFEESILFHYEGENAVDLDSDITDHYSENNESLQDQISLRPEIVRTLGYIGELNDVPPEELRLLDDKLEKLTAISGYIPELTLGALRTYNLVSQAYNSIQALSTGQVSKWDGSTDQNKQQIAYANFYGYWKERRLFTVQTPWRKFENMAIQSIKVVQDADTDKVSTFALVFKQMRFASSENEDNSILIAGRADSQNKQGSGVDRGVINPSPTSATMSSFIA